jgi:hypothetical protein
MRPEAVFRFLPALVYSFPQAPSPARVATWRAFEIFGRTRNQKKSRAARLAFFLLGAESSFVTSKGVNLREMPAYPASTGETSCGFCLALPNFWQGKPWLLMPMLFISLPPMISGLYS